MSALKPYPAYKDSGVGWLGQIPASWASDPLGRWFEERKTTVSDEDYPALSVTKKGVVPQLSDVAKTENNANRRLVLAGDFAINSRSDRKGSAGVSELDGSVSVITTVLRGRGLEPRFTHFLLRSQPFQEEFYRWGHGIVEDLWSTRWSEMKNIRLPIPSELEQRAIADFLDRETAEIDAFVAESEKLITLLNERRTAVITQAVTKGLDPTVPMKDTGIEWLGSIPRHWTIRRASELGTLLNGYPFVSESFNAYSNGAIPVVKIADVLGNEFQHYVNRDDLPSNPPLVHQDDLVIGLSGDFNVTLWTREPAVLNQRTAAFRCHDNRLPGFVLHLLSVAIKYEHEMQHSTTLKNLAPGAIMRLRIPIPPSEELLKILSVTNTATAKIDKAIQASQQAIALAKERRQALISAAVTGKIDVRGAA